MQSHYHQAKHDYFKMSQCASMLSKQAAASQLYAGLLAWLNSSSSSWPLVLDPPPYWSWIRPLLLASGVPQGRVLGPLLFILDENAVSSIRSFSSFKATNQWSESLWSVPHPHTYTVTSTCRSITGSRPFSQLQNSATGQETAIPLFNLFFLLLEFDLIIVWKQQWRFTIDIYSTTSHQGALSL